MDRESSNSGHRFKTDQSQIGVRAVFLDGIVSAFDQIKDVEARRVARAIVFPVGAFDLEGGRSFPRPRCPRRWRSGSCCRSRRHRAKVAGASRSCSTAEIGVMRERRRRPPSSDPHEPCIHDELRVSDGTTGPAHDAAREAVVGCRRVPLITTAHVV